MRAHHTHLYSIDKEKDKKRFNLLGLSYRLYLLIFCVVVVDCVRVLSSGLFGVYLLDGIVLLVLVYSSLCISIYRRRCRSESIVYVPLIPYGF